MTEKATHTHHGPVSQKCMDNTVDCITDGLVDAFEDALADVDNYLNHNYDRKQLVESMKLAISIDDEIEFLSQYHSSKLAPDEG